MKNTIVVENRKAKHNYNILSTLECGICLKGNEVKSIRSGKAQLSEAYICIENNELIMRNCHISKWDTANDFDTEERRDRKLLAHKREIEKLESQVKLDGITLIPLKLYFAKNNKCKVEVAVCRGKHLYDKRQTEKEKTVRRDIERHLAK